MIELWKLKMMGREAVMGAVVLTLSKYLMHRMFYLCVESILLLLLLWLSVSELSF
jgi:hypothetical protein